MGNGARNRVLDRIPSEIKRVFQVTDIKKTFDMLEQFFHTPKQWRVAFEEKLKNSPRSFDEREVFAEFLVQTLDPALKHITKREDSVVLSIMHYVVKDRIKEKRREQV